MLYVHMNFSGSPRKLYVPHTSFGGFFGTPVKGQNSTYDYIALTRGDIPDIKFTSEMSYCISGFGAIIWHNLCTFTHITM